MDPVIGLDLGTTSSAAFSDTEDRKLEAVKFPDGSLLYPSVVAYEFENLDKPPSISTGRAAFGHDNQVLEVRYI